MKKIAFAKFLPAMVWFAIINILISIPGDDLPKVGSWFDLFNTDKLIHAGIFFGLVFLLFLPILKSSNCTHVEKRNLLFYCVLFGVVWGTATELIQKYWIPGRNADIKDVIADAAGALICWLFCLVLLKRKKQVVE